LLDAVDEKPDPKAVGRQLAKGGMNLRLLAAALAVLALLQTSLT
jgi:hypothetical protein